MVWVKRHLIMIFFVFRKIYKIILFLNVSDHEYRIIIKECMCVYLFVCFYGQMARPGQANEPCQGERD